MTTAQTYQPIDYQFDNHDRKQIEFVRGVIQRLVNDSIDTGVSPRPVLEEALKLISSKLLEYADADVVRSFSRRAGGQSPRERRVTYRCGSVQM